METDLVLQGSATDTIWAMMEEDGRIGLRLDCGDAGRVCLTKDQALGVIDTLQKMLSATTERE